MLRIGKAIAKAPWLLPYRSLREISARTEPPDIPQGAIDAKIVGLTGIHRGLFIGRRPSQVLQCFHDQ